MSHIEWLLEIGIDAGEGHWWWVAPVSDQADIAFRRAIDRLNGFIDTAGVLKKVDLPYAFTKNETRRIIKCNGATFWFKSADEPNSLFGEDVRGAVGDEITRWKDRSYIAVYTTLTATKGRLKLIGNVNGRKNFAYKLARAAQSGLEDWAYYKLTAYDAAEGGVIDPAIIAQAERDLNKDDFKELYLAEPSEDGTNPFNAKSIGDCIKPLSTKPVVAWGCDLARKRDWLALVGLDEDGVVAAHHRWTKFVLWGEKEAEIGRLVGDVPILVDSSGVGDRVVEALSQLCSSLTGYQFTESSRQQLLEGLQVAIQNGEIGYPEGEITSQLYSFDKEYTRIGVKYIVPDNGVDDDAIALALAREQYRTIMRGVRVNLGSVKKSANTYNEPTF